MNWSELPNLFGFFAVAFLLLWFPVCAYIGHRLTRKVKTIEEEPTPDPVAPTPVHVHIIDLERGDVTITDIGGIAARCTLAGCRESVYIAPSLSRAMVADSLEMRGR